MLKRMQIDSSRISGFSDFISIFLKQKAYTVNLWDNTDSAAYQLNLAIYEQLRKQQ